MTLMAQRLLTSTFLTAFAGSLSAATVSYVSGTECSGPGGFANCTVAGYATIIKFDDTLSVDDTGNFPSITGTEFTFTNVTNTSGTWLYTPDDATDPVIKAVAVKAGPGYTLYSDLTPAEMLGFTYFTPNAKDLSHITFLGVEPEPQPVPLPAGGLLLLSGVAGLAALRRRA